MYVFAYTYMYIMYLSSLHACLWPRFQSNSWQSLEQYHVSLHAEQAFSLPSAGFALHMAHLPFGPSFVISVVAPLSSRLAIRRSVSTLEPILKKERRRCKSLLLQSHYYYL